MDQDVNQHHSLSDSSSKRLLRLYGAIEAAHEHLRRAAELERQAQDLLKEVDAYHRRAKALGRSLAFAVSPSSRPSRSSTSSARAPRRRADAAKGVG
jgi:uncharacterized protein YhaN